MLKEKKDESKKKKKKDVEIYILLHNEMIVLLEFKFEEDKKHVKSYLKRKKKQLKEVEADIDMMPFTILQCRISCYVEKHIIKIKSKSQDLKKVSFCYIVKFSISKMI